MSKSQRQQAHQQSKTIQQLQSELRRKGKALAEAALLIVEGLVLLLNVGDEVITQARINTVTISRLNLRLLSTAS
ncbi:MAG: hypothetical protein JRG71_16545 [Deltaproteobacteria bacterium]|nr:hypothetical protein [Deltaproteobacteria bacterium]